MEIKVGDIINGFEIEKISKDPFVFGQIDIFVNAYEENWQGDRSQVIFRVMPKEKALASIELLKKHKNGEEYSIEELIEDANS